MNITLITVGLIFLLNPCVWLWDFLPDFIGAALIIFGIRKVIYIREENEKLYNRLWILAAVSFAKCALAFLLNDSDGSTKVLFGLIFASVEAIILILVLTGCLGSMSEMRLRYYAEDTPSREENDVSRLKGLVVVYTLVRLFFGLLPELSELTLKGAVGSTVTEDDFSLADYKWIIYALFTFVIAIYMIAISVKTVKAMKAYASEKATVSSIERAAIDYREKRPDEWSSKNWRGVYRLLVLGAFFSIYFYVDGINYIPNVLAAVVFAAISLIVSTSTGQKVLALAVNGALAALSVVSVILLIGYFSSENYTELSVFWSDDAKAKYTLITVLLIAEAVVHYAAIIVTTELVYRRKKADMKELGGRRSDKKHILIQITVMRIVYGIVFIAALAYPLVRVDFPFISMILPPLGIFALFFAYYLDLSDLVKK